MKKVISLIVVFALCFTMAVSASAASIEDTEDIVSEEILQQHIQDVNNYLAEHAEPIDLEEQIIEYTIPLSDGTSAEYTIELTKLSQNARTIFDAKLGTWIFTSSVNLPLHGKITVNTTVNIYHVPTEQYDFVRFRAYNGNVSAIPVQFSSITGTSAETSVVYSEIWYQTAGYVGFDILGLPFNVYFTQDITFVNNHDQNTKIQCVMNYEI